MSAAMQLGGAGKRTAAVLDPLLAVICLARCASGVAEKVIETITKENVVRHTGCIRSLPPASAT